MDLLRWAAEEPEKINNVKMFGCAIACIILLGFLLTRSKNG